MRRRYHAKRGHPLLAAISVSSAPIVSESLAWRLVALSERFVAALLLVVMAPILVFLIVLTAVLCGRPPLIAHRRVGHLGSSLWILKLRTKWDGAGGTAR